jgi:phage tail-like protein
VAGSPTCGIDKEAKMQLSDILDAGASPFFVVQIDNVMLGHFQGCEGLGCEVVVERREEGGMNGYVHVLPTRLNFPNVKLSRPISMDSVFLHKWFNGIHSGMTRHTAVIEAHNSLGIPIGVWGLNDVMPVRWTGPSLGNDQNKVVTETLELAYHGFFPPTKLPGL